MAGWAGWYVRPDCQTTRWTDPFRSPAFYEARHDDDAEKKNDEKGNFQKTDRHTLISASFYVQ